MKFLTEGVMLLAASILSLATPALAAECHTLRDARTQWPNSHLRYSIEGKKAGGKPCWHIGPAAARVIRAPMPRPEQTPQQRIDAAFGSFIMIGFDPPGWFALKPKQIEVY